jgi:DNA-binding Lrp family transcriptional regulator
MPHTPDTPDAPRPAGPATLHARLLAAVQRRVPLVREPFQLLAADLGAGEDDVLARLAELRSPRGVIREISGIFDAAALGYRQALVAMAVPGGSIDAAGRTAAGHPGVSHCYGREGRYNLWLTLAVSPSSALGLEATAERLAGLCGAEAWLLLPAVKRYKLAVRFPMTGEQAATPPTAPLEAAPEEAVEPPAAGRPGRRTAPCLSDPQRRAIRALQTDLPTRADPFAPLAAEAGLAADDLLVHAADFLAAGWMRRYAAVLRHRAAGAAANVLVAWCVRGEHADAAGAAAARLPAVSHCFLRPARPGWPYTLYTMVHGRSREDCRRTVEALSAALAAQPPARPSDRPTARPTDQLTNRPTDDRTTRPTDQPTNRPTDQPIPARREPTDQLTSHPTDQPSPALLWTLAEYAKRRVPLFSEDEAEWEAQHRSG